MCKIQSRLGFFFPPLSGGIKLRFHLLPRKIEVFFGQAYRQIRGVIRMQFFPTLAKIGLHLTLGIIIYRYARELCVVAPFQCVFRQRNYSFIYEFLIRALACLMFIWRRTNFLVMQPQIRASIINNSVVCRTNYIRNVIVPASMLSFE